jgi:restriction system protein
MNLWLVRAGPHGEQEQVALDENVITIAWNELPDLSKFNNRGDLVEFYKKTFPEAKMNQISNHVGQLWRFSHDIQPGDLVAIPLNIESSISLGKVLSNYEYKELTNDVKHIIPVKWLKRIPRSAFDKDLLYSFGAIMTVCQIQRNRAVERVLKLLNDDTKPERGNIKQEIEDIIEETEEIDIEEYSQDQIVKNIEAKFKGHGLARLIDAILKAQGYITRISPPGRDGGIDILAAPGPLGFDNPRICVQIKSSNSPADVKVYRELKGVMSQVRADQGLFVSWGGFNSEVKLEAKADFFSMRLWDQGNIIQEIFKYYEKFDDELKAELPLKRIWSLVIEE